MEKIVNVYPENWITKISQLAFSNHLICTGEKSNLQWFGTRLIQKLGDCPNSEISPIYGRLAVNFEDFCYQLCHSTPWGFEMGQNMNAIRDVIRGESAPQNKFFIFYDAQFLYLKNYKNFETLYQVFMDVAQEYEERGQNLKLILLLEDQEKISTRRLIRRKEQFPIEVLKIIQEE